MKPFIFSVSEANCPLLEVLEAVRPHLQLNFENILAHINTIYVLKTKQGAMGLHERYLRLKVRIQLFEGILLLSDGEVIDCLGVRDWKLKVFRANTG